MWVVQTESGQPPASDRRVRRSRAALMRAAIALVTERGTAAVAVSEIAEAADVSRRLVYQHFRDRDDLLLEAALDLARRELMPHATENPQAASGRERVLAVARHFADHRAFYQALFTGSCALALERGLTDLLLPVNRQRILRLYGDRLPPPAVDDLATFWTGGWAAFVTAWIVTGSGPLDPEAFTDRLLRMLSILGAATPSSAGTPPREDPR